MQAGIQPNIVTYNSLIDAYGRNGQVCGSRTLHSLRWVYWFLSPPPDILILDLGCFSYLYTYSEGLCFSVQ
jgi:hypothetical protein